MAARLHYRASSVRAGARRFLWVLLPALLASAPAAAVSSSAGAPPVKSAPQPKPAPEMPADAPTVVGPNDSVTLSFRDTSLQEVYQMLSQQGRVNILLGKGVSGSVSINLFHVSLEQAIRSIAEAAGYVAEKHDGTWMIIDRKEAGQDAVNTNTEVRTFKVQYSDPKVVAELLSKHVSRFGKVTLLPGRKLIVVEDLPEFLDRIQHMLTEIDVQPKQILIEAKILEITLNDNQTFGIDWSHLFHLDGGTANYGTTGLAPGASSGFFFQLMTPNIDVFLKALSDKGRVHTLSTPKLLVLENQEAQVVIGDRVGYKVTTTINQVTTESIQFLDSGVILKVKAAVDGQGRVLLDIHPEVSTAKVTDGIPSLQTTEVTTQMLAADGQRIFIGGLIKSQTTETRSGVPLLSDIPVLGAAFSQQHKSHVNTETVVIITPHIVDANREAAVAREMQTVRAAEHALQFPPSMAPAAGPSGASAAAAGAADKNTKPPTPPDPVPRLAASDAQDEPAPARETQPRPVADPARPNAGR